MTTKAERRLVRQWEENLVADFYDYRCRILLEPLYEQFQQWKDGSVDHETILDAVHQVHRENRERYNFFAQKREDLARAIQYYPWFAAWLEEHPAPVGADILPPEVTQVAADDWAPEESAATEKSPPEDAAPKEGNERGESSA
jgi:hypothetical protein